MKECGHIFKSMSHLRGGRRGMSFLVLLLSFAHFLGSRKYKTHRHEQSGRYNDSVPHKKFPFSPKSSNASTPPICSSDVPNSTQKRSNEHFLGTRNTTTHRHEQSRHLDRFDLQGRHLVTPILANASTPPKFFSLWTYEHQPTIRWTPSQPGPAPG